MNTVLDLPWHVEPWRIMQQYLLSGRVPQALLIKGHAGLGKLTLAQRFTAALLCEQRSDSQQACGVCHACLLLKAQTHPDYLELKPEEGKRIGIDAIRELLPKLALKPQFASYRVVLIQSAEQMNTASANAFLKCLEEPNERTVILLVTASPERLPATIRSRCQQMQVAKPAHALALSWLQAQQLSEDPELLLLVAQGAPLLALEYAQQQHLSLRNTCFKEWCQVGKHQKSPVTIAEKWQALPAVTLLNWLCSWICDLIKCYYVNDIKLFYNQDLLPLLQDGYQQLELKGLLNYYAFLLANKQNCHTTLNKQLMFEAILIHWSKLNCTD